MGRAELVADGGVAAHSAADFFRSAAFCEAEGVTHTLRVVAPGFEAMVPLIVREIDGGHGIDASSPYGYPGASVTGGPPPPIAAVDWSETGLVSVFARERLDGRPWLADAHERGTVLVHDPGSERELRPRLAEQIRANERDGWSVRVTAGAESTVADRDAFAAVYEQTMHRTGAAERYFFSRSYLDAALSFERSWLGIAELDASPGAAAILAAGDGVLHYFLGGTSDDAREASPFKNVVAAMLDLADELGLPLNLGGGLRPGDGLERFKRGFANSRLPFVTHEVVCDGERYAELAGSRGGGEFFPAYRGP